MPDPKGEEARPEEEDDGEDQIQHLQEQQQKKHMTMVSTLEEDEKHFRAVVFNRGSSQNTQRNVQMTKSNGTIFRFRFQALDVKTQN